MCIRDRYRVVHQIKNILLLLYRVWRRSKHALLPDLYGNAAVSYTHLDVYKRQVHGDDRGLKLPPKVAPIQCRIIPIAAHKGGVIEKCDELLVTLKAAGIRAEVDDRDQSTGWKFNDCELKGIPVRLEVGPRDIEQGQACLLYTSRCV